MKITEWLNTEMLRVIGWSIIHSMWQFLFLFAVLKTLLLLISKSRPALRYYIGTALLATSVICSGLTFNHEYKLFFNDDAKTFISTINTANDFALLKPAAISNLTNKTAPAVGTLLLNFLDGISPCLTFGWMIGIALYLVKIINGGLYLSRLRNLKGELYPYVNKRMLEITVKLKINKSIKLTVSDFVKEPLTFGYFKPVILLPCSYITRVPMEQLEMILAHELAHIKRHDYLVNLVQTTLEAIYFYNPFFRAMSSIVRNERECCCDNIAANVCGSKKNMAIALANLKIITGSSVLALSAAPRKSAFFERINRLTNPALRSGTSLKNMFFTFILVLFALLFFMDFTFKLHAGDILPAAADPVTQLLTDNQADYKEQLFTYTKGAQSHELFLVSTIYGKPLYAYLDGEAASKDQLQKIIFVVNRRRNVTAAEIAAAAKNPVSIRAERHVNIYAETDSLNKLMLKASTLSAIHPSAGLSNQVKDLKHQVDMVNKEEVDLSMAEYRDEIQSIPVAVKLHVLLTKIITNKEYTAEERKELNALVRKRQGV